MKPWFKPYIDKDNYKKSINNLIVSDKLTMGNSVRELESFIAKELDIKYVCLTTSGTSALLISSIIINYDLKNRKRKRKKVICTNLTWVATINPFILQDFEIFLVDTLDDSDEVNFDELNKSIIKIKPDVVLLVHLNGNCLYNKKFDLLKKKLKFVVVEDSAQSLFIKDIKGRFSGTRYDIGCFSLGITKPFNMIYGGFCVTNSKKIYKKMVAIRNNGVPEIKNNKKLELATMVGLNLRPSNAHTVLGLINIKKYKKILNQIKKIHKHYCENLKNKKIKIVKYSHHQNYCYVQALVSDRRKFMIFAKKNNIQIHTGIRCLSESNNNLNVISSKNSINFSKKSVRLPCGPGYKIEDIDKFCKIFTKY